MCAVREILPIWDSIWSRSYSSSLGWCCRTTSIAAVAVFNSLIHKTGHVLKDEFHVHIWNSFAAVLIERMYHIVTTDGAHLVEIAIKSVVISMSKQ